MINLLTNNPIFLLFFMSLLGLMIGSFLNVVIYRLPLMLEFAWQQHLSELYPDKIAAPEDSTLSLSLPRSHCPHCKKQIRAYDNIPIISWLLLKGQCRYCAHKISYRYPLTELISMLAAGLAEMTYGATWYMLAVFFCVCFLIIMSYIDLDRMLLPDQLTLPLMWSGIAIAVLDISPIPLYDAVLGAMTAYLFFWGLYWTFKLLTGKEGLGYGDFKLFAALGAWLGWQQLPFVLLIASTLGLCWGGLQLLAKKKKQSEPFPFGPFLAIAGFICLFWGQQVSHVYLQYVLAGG